MKILGLSAFYHDSAVALAVDGNIVAAAQEERFNRIKHYAGFPTQALEYVLKEGKIGLNEIDFVAFYDKPFLKFERLLETYLAFAPKGFSSFLRSMPVWLKDKLFQRKMLEKTFGELVPQMDWKERLLFVEHHHSHAASAFFPSPFSEAAVLTMDGVGEWATTSLAIGSGNNLDITKEIHFPHSLGLLYSAFTYHMGFKVNSGEYKAMGLAPYGKPRFVDKIREHLIDIKDDGSYRLNLKYFDYCTGLHMTNDLFAEVFEGPARQPESLLTQREMDLAASVQTITEEIVLKLTRSIAKQTGLQNLCLAGGVALNCVANGKVLRDGSFKDIWIQPAAGDAGGALGAALSAYYQYCGSQRVVTHRDQMQGSYLGPQFSQNEIAKRLLRAGAVYSVLNDNDLIKATVEALTQESAIGWYQGRMEFGPRALGARSIIGDPRSPNMQKTLNLKVKYRESFRPFAPSVLAEDVSEWFEFSGDSPYMLMVAELKDEKKRQMTKEEDELWGIDKLNVVRSAVPAVTHIDYSARIQTVHRDTNPLYHRLLTEFKEKTKCPVLINTSFNIRGEPIVCTPEDAFRCFMGTDLDVLVIGNCFLRKPDQNQSLKQQYQDKFALD
jgi:carbamoyltransferase